MPRLAHRRVILFFWPMRASSLHEGSDVNHLCCLFLPLKVVTHRHVVGSRAVVSRSYGCVTLHAVGPVNGPTPECLMHEA